MQLGKEIGGRHLLLQEGHIGYPSKQNGNLKRGSSGEDKEEWKDSRGI